MSETIEKIRIMPSTREEIFDKAYSGSYYTILGWDGSLEEWINGYCDLLDKEGIGKPEQFITFKGSDMNIHYGLTDENAYRSDLNCLMFPLDGLDVGKLAFFKLRMQDRWFDDIVDNNERRQKAIDAIRYQG